MPNDCDQTVAPFLGLEFDVFCDSDLDEHDLGSASATNVQECVDSCNHHWGCFGSTWTSYDNQCWFKYSGVSSKDIVNKTGAVSVLPKADQLNQTTSDIVCPYPNLSRNTTSSGLEFTILCGAVLYGDNLYDITIDSYPQMHANDLHECLENCANNSPLCSRVTYDADRTTDPWLNCWLKPASDAKPYPAVGGMRHSAYAQIPTLKPVDCKNNSLHTAIDGRVFKASCMDRRVLNDTNILPLSTAHADSIDTCMGQCSNLNQNCTSFAFDVSLQSGYRNCYLFGELPPALVQDDEYTFMYLESSSSQFRAPPTKPSQGLTKSQLTASITMPLLIALVTLTSCYIWYRRKQYERKYAPVKGD